MKKLYKIGLILLSISPLAFAEESRFTRQNDVVTDNKTKLEWVDDKKHFQDLNTKEEKMLTWEKGIDYCEGLTLNSQYDWRVPNINELKTIIDRSYKEMKKNKDGDEIYPSAIYDIFENIGMNNNSTYSSSTSTLNLFGSMFVVKFGNGSILGDDVAKASENSAYYRCVRGG